MDLDKFIGATSSMPLAIDELGLNLLIGAFLAYLVKWHFFRFSNSLSNRTEFTSVLPFILLTTIFIISIVKSSLALSLGLVGALSIVRFRTPIKEPEELAYLFISIAIGLGLGANQIIATIVSAISILILMTIFMKKKNANQGVGEIYVNISGTKEGSFIEGALTQGVFEKLLAISERVVMNRYIVSGSNYDITFHVSFFDPNKIDEFVLDMEKSYPLTSITILDQRNLPPL